MRGALAVLILACCVAGIAAQGAPSTQTFKAIGDYLGFKPGDTDTIFVPSDAAFEDLAKVYGLKSAKDFLSPKYADLLTKLGAAHTVETAAYKAANLKSGQQLKTIQGTTLTVTKAADGAITVKGATNSAKVLAADRASGTAVVHVIDKVLVPSDVYPTLLGALEARPGLKQWAQLFKDDPAAKTKASDPQFQGTYFAPNDAGVKKFVAKDQTLLGAFGATKADIGLVLAYHSTPSAFGYAQLANLSASQPLASSLKIGGVPEPIFHGVKGGRVELWGTLSLQDRSTIVEKDIHVGAGVLHVVDFPLVPDLETSARQSVTQAVEGRADLKALARLINSTGILDELDDPAFAGTLFAPTDKAFEAFAKSLGFASVDAIYKFEPLLDAILGHHLVPEAYPADRLKQFAPFTIAPFTGGNLRLGRAGAAGQLTVEGAQNKAAITLDGIDAGRSVVYKIDAVVLPDSVFPTIIAALDFYASTSVLQNLVKATPALSKLAADPKTAATVFAPRNDAFQALGPEFVDLVFAQNATRAEGLGYHIVPGPARLVPVGFKNGDVLKTLLKGQDLRVEVKAIEDPPSNTKVGRLVVVPTGGPAATAQRINIFAGQSVIHGVDRVLVPKGI